MIVRATCIRVALVNKLDHALSLAERGFNIIPLRVNDKRPLYGGKFLDQATKDPGTIKKIWAKAPNANIGIATGQGLTVIDIDTLAHGADGSESLIDYELENGFLEDTLEVTTPTGGKHLYYQTSTQYGNATGIIPGVDVRGQGGYVVAPGSTIKGKAYTITKDIPIAKADETVISLLNQGSIKEDKDSLDDSLDQLEKGYSDELIPCGQRTDYLISQCGQLCDGTRSKETIKALLRVINETNLETPLSDKELEQEVFPSIERLKRHELKNVNKEALIDPKKIGLTRVSDIKKKPVEWLIPGYIPKGAITIVGGDGGLGKTSLWCNIASAISNGSSCCLSEAYDKAPQGKVIYFSGEDDTSRVLKQRLELNNANLDNIATLQLEDDNFSYISIGGELLENIVELEKPTLVIFDPIQQFIKDCDMTKRNDMRQTLASLTKLGNQYGTSFILVMHTNKRDKVGSFRDKLSDSADLWDIARSVLAIGRNKDKELFITHEKSSYCIRQKAIVYSIIDGKIVRDYFDDERQTYIDFIGDKTSKSDKANEREVLKEIYLELLEPGEQPKKDIEERLKTMGYTLNMIKTVYRELVDGNKIETTRVSGGKNQGIKTLIKLKNNA